MFADLHFQHCRFGHEVYKEGAEVFHFPLIFHNIHIMVGALITVYRCGHTGASIYHCIPMTKFENRIRTCFF